MSMNTRSKRGRLLAQLNGGTDITILGWVVWWNIREIEISQERFKEILTACEFKESYAREHNYRSAFLRALKQMEEKRIIRLVKEDSKYLIYQFTAEDLVDDETGFEYSSETVITIDKDKYRETKSIDLAIIKGDDSIKDKIIKIYYDEKSKFKSADVSRVLHRIFTDEADIVSLRDQGSVYFIPGGYKTVLDRAVKYVKLLGGNCKLDSLPIPDAPESRDTVRDAVTDEFDSFMNHLRNEIDLIQDGKDVTDRWFNTKRKKMAEVKERFELYSELLGEGKSGLEAQFAELEKQLFAGRELDLA